MFELINSKSNKAAFASIAEFIALTIKYRHFGVALDRATYGLRDVRHFKIDNHGPEKTASELKERQNFVIE